MAKVKNILETISKEKKQHGKTITMGTIEEEDTVAI